MWLSVWSVFFLQEIGNTPKLAVLFIINDIYCKLYPLELIPRLAMASPNREGSEGSIANFQLYFDEIPTPCFAIQLVGSTIQIHWLLTSWRVKTAFCDSLNQRCVQYVTSHFLPFPLLFVYQYTIGIAFLPYPSEPLEWHPSFFASKQSLAPRDAIPLGWVLWGAVPLVAVTIVVGHFLLQLMEVITWWRTTHCS